MKVMSRVVVGTVLVLMLTAVWAVAQSRTQAPQYRTVPMEVLSGENIGFRIEARRGEAAVGKLVVRIDGKWVVTEFSPKSIIPTAAP